MHTFVRVCEHRYTRIHAQTHIVIRKYIRGYAHVHPYMFMQMRPSATTSYDPPSRVMPVSDTLYLPYASCDTGTAL